MRLVFPWAISLIFFKCRSFHQLCCIMSLLCVWSMICGKLCDRDIIQFIVVLLCAFDSINHSVVMKIVLSPYWHTHDKRQHRLSRFNSYPLVSPRCVADSVVIGLENGLLLVRCQAFIWTNDDYLSITPLGTEFDDKYWNFHWWNWT